VSGANESTPRTTTATASATSCIARRPAPIATTIAAASTPQTNGEAWRKERIENAAIPRMLPRMSHRYASSGGNRTKTRPTP
jgi:hypothetical protein